jgi:phosphate transport system permease protein
VSDPGDISQAPDRDPPAQTEGLGLLGDRPDLAGPLTPSGNLRRRTLINRLAESVATGSALLAIAVLGILVYSVVQRGAGALSFDFLTKDPPAFGQTGGGI